MPASSIDLADERHQPCAMRKTNTCATLAAALLILPSCAGLSPACAAQTTAVMERERDWVTAMCGHDTTRLTSILAEEFVLTFVDRSQTMSSVPRALWLDNLGHMTFGDVRMAEPVVTMHGEKVATVRMRMHLQDWMVGTHPLPADYDLTDVWVDRDGRWQVVMRISEPL